MRYFLRRFIVLLLAIGAAALAMPATSAVPNYQGLWYAAPAESEAGWGVNLAHQGEIIFATWFTYDASGKAWWLTMTAPKTADGVYTGTIYTTSGAPFSAFVPPATATAVGTGTLTFASTDAGTFAYTVNGSSQSKAIVPQVFGERPTCEWGAQPDLTKATNFQDLWYAAPAESEAGWGVNLTQQGTTIFATWFTYDANRNPLWLSATLPQTAPNTFGGTLYLTSGPAFNAVPFSPAAVTLKAVGTATFTFTDGNNGTFAYNVDLGDGINKAVQSKPITRQVFRSPGTVCAAAASGVGTAEGIWRGTTDQGQALRIVILDDGTYYIVFSEKGSQAEAGVLHGKGASVNGKFTSADVAVYGLGSGTPQFIGGGSSIGGTFVPHGTLHLSFGSSSVNATYDTTYDRPPNLAGLAGSYMGSVGHATESRMAPAAMDGLGALRINGVQCDFLVQATARGSGSVFNAFVSSGSCYGGPAIMFYEEATRKLFVLAAFDNQLLGIADLWFTIQTRQ